MSNTSEKEKLVELIAKAKRSMWGKSGLSCELARNMYLAENLIANGVTFATDNNVGDKWISVKDRLPDKECLAVCMLAGRPAYNEMLVGWVGKDTMCETGYICESGGEFLPDVTHWMPLPQPPKEDL